MRSHVFAAALSLASCFSPARAQAVADHTGATARSATIARDIGSVTLGMSLADVRQIASVNSLGNDNFEATRDGITYDLQVTCLGRVYRVASSQPLGRFQVDETFLRALASKLTAKYGTPSSQEPETMAWELIEPVKRSSGQTLPFKTMWASAYVSSGSEGITLEIKLLDFRIMWADEATLNRAPRDKAIDDVTL